MGLWDLGGQHGKVVQSDPALPMGRFTTWGRG